MFGEKRQFSTPDASAMRLMSPINTTTDGEFDDQTGDDIAPANRAPDDTSGAQAAPRQETWFGITERDQELVRGPFAGVVFNRPIEQVFTYRVPSRLESDHPGRVSGCACRWAGAIAGGRLLRAGRPRLARRPRAVADQGRRRSARPLPLIDRQDARADALDGGLLRLLVGPGARCRGAGGGQEARGDAGRDVPGRARGDSSRLAGLRSSSGRCRPSRPAVLEILCRGGRAV